MSVTDRNLVDCLIIGAGPAGLTAAMYLSRFRRRVHLMDSGNSRAAHIPRSHNVPGFPTGVSGPGLLGRIRRQAEAAGVVIVKGVVDSLEHDEHGFHARTASERIQAPRVLLATGSADRAPLPGLSRRATWQGRVRWCPICDGYEALDERVLLIAEPRHAEGHALFLRTYTRELNVAWAAHGMADHATARRLRAAGVQTLGGVPKRLRLGLGGKCSVEMDNGQTHEFDVVYPMTGGEPQIDLAKRLGPRLSEDGRMRVDAHQETSIPGLYAAGDVVASLAQIAVAVSEGAVAATSIHGSLPRNFR